MGNKKEQVPARAIFVQDSLYCECVTRVAAPPPAAETCVCFFEFAI